MPTLLLLAGLAVRRDLSLRDLEVAGCLAVGTIVLPVAVTTAGGVETQAFALSHLLCGALVWELVPRPRS